MSHKAEKVKMKDEVRNEKDNEFTTYGSFDFRNEHECICRR